MNEVWEAAIVNGGTWVEQLEESAGNIDQLVNMWRCVRGKSNWKVWVNAVIAGNSRLIVRGRGKRQGLITS